MSFFICPKSPISSNSPAIERDLIWTSMYWFPSMYKEMQHFFILRWICFTEKLVLLMSALILYCATSMLHVLHRHAPDLILTRLCQYHTSPENATYVWHKMAFLTYLDHGWRLVQWSVGHFSSKFRPKLGILFFIQNAKFCDFVRFSSKTNFLCPYIAMFHIRVRGQTKCNSKYTKSNSKADSIRRTWFISMPILCLTSCLHLAIRSY